MAINALLSCPVSLPPEEVLEGDLAMEASAAGRERIALVRPPTHTPTIREIE